MKHDPLTLRDVAVLCDGLRKAPPPGVAGRLSELGRRDERAAELEALARDAGLAEEMEGRLTAAWEIREDLTHLLEAGEWEDPYPVLAPGSRRRPIELRALLALAESWAARPRPPAGLDAVREKLARAVAALEHAETQVETLVAGLLDRDPRQVEELLRYAVHELQRRSAARGSSGARDQPPLPPTRDAWR